MTHWYFRRQIRFYTVSGPMTRWLARHVADFDVLHVHALFSYATVAASLVAAHRGVPFVVRPLGTLNRWGMTHRRRLLKALSFRLVERRILARAARIHYTSERERRDAAALGVDAPSVVVPLGVRLGALQRVSAAGWLHRVAPHLAGRTVFLFLSRLDPIKGLDLLLPAFAAVRARRPDVALVLAGEGEGSFVAGLRSQAARLGIDRDVHWAGFLGDDDKRQALAAADVFVLPSYSESFGLAAVEAMASGVPLIVSDQVGICDEIERGHAGLVTACDAGRLADAMVRLVEAPDLQRRMRECGPRLASERFSTAAMASSLEAVYAEAIAGAPARRRRPRPGVVV